MKSCRDSGKWLKTPIITQVQFNFCEMGGNIYSLQRILGHATLDMVKRYLAISQIDLDRDHAAASPVTHWLGQ